jgi:amidase
MTESLYWWSAVDLAAGIRSQEISAAEVMVAHLDRIEQVNPSITAIVSQFDRPTLLRQAERADRAVSSGDDLGPLHGLPTAVKDLMDVAGLPTVHGSAAHAEARPASRDSVLAERLRGSGAIIVGKTNTPEHGLGTLTFNPVFGTTTNPWDLDRHAGGSSGGAAAAVASGMLPVADGSDSGGSLRYPAAFCGVVGLRTTPGAVPSGRPGNAWSPHAVLGPMARNSVDAALLMAGISGIDERWPLSWVEDPLVFLAPHDAAIAGVRLGWNDDMGGLPIDSEVRAVHAAARSALEAAGATIVDVDLDFGDADASWKAIELFEFYLSGREELATGRDGLREDYLRNVDEGAALDAKTLADALGWRTELYRHTARALHGLDGIVFPATPVAAPPVADEWVHAIDGHEFDRYFGWQAMANRITATGHPALITPAGFTAAGLPVGIQIVGAYREDRRLLALGSAIERALGIIGLRPGAIPA